MNKTTKVLSLTLALVAIAGMISFADQAMASSHKGGSSGSGGVGAGGYQMQLIGVTDSDGKLPNSGGSSGHSMFVPLDGQYRILLTSGDFKILDRDATDGVGAFRLPPPNINCEDDISDACVDANADYYVYARVLGSPHSGTGDFTSVTCADEVSIDANGNGVIGDDEVCSLESVSLPSSNGAGKNAKFSNVTKELLTMCIDTTDDGMANCDKRVDIFDPRLEDYIWLNDNNNNKVIQLRFIQQG